MTKHKCFIGFIAAAVAVLSILVMLSRDAVQADLRRLTENRELVRRLELTDLALWTEARYTRHPSQTDLFTPFQEFPSSLEHFPAGSIVYPGRGNTFQQQPSAH